LYVFLAGPIPTPTNEGQVMTSKNHIPFFDDFIDF